MRPIFALLPGFSGFEAATMDGRGMNRVDGQEVAELVAGLPSGQTFDTVIVFGAMVRSS
jgi:hypothetical protein